MWNCNIVIKSQPWLTVSLSWTRITKCAFWAFLGVEKSTYMNILTPKRGGFRQRAGDKAQPCLFIPSSTSFGSIPLPHPLCMSISSLFPTPHPPPEKKIHWHPPPPSLTRARAPCWVKWTVPMLEELCAARSAQPGSAQLGVLNLLCDYCRSESPPPGRSAMMGTIWHRAQPAMEFWNKGAKEKYKPRARKGHRGRKEILLMWRDWGRKNRGRWAGGQSIIKGKKKARWERKDWCVPISADKDEGRHAGSDIKKGNRENYAPAEEREAAGKSVEERERERERGRQRDWVEKKGRERN